MPHRDAIVQFIRSTIAADFDAQRDELVPLLDSVGLVQLVMFLEERFQVTLDIAETGLEPFTNVDSLVAAVESFRHSASGVEVDDKMSVVESASGEVCALDEEHIEAARILWDEYVEALREFDKDLGYNENSFDLIVRGMQGGSAASGRFLVQSLGNELRGFVIARIRMSPPYMGARREGFIADMYVPSKHRGCGIASLLYEGALAFFRKAGVGVVALEVLEHNEGARRFWQKLGFRDYFREMRAKI